MPVNYAAENVLGTFGAVCWTIQLTPQIWKSWRSKSTDGLSPYLVGIWSISGVWMGIYAILQDLNVPLIVQPHLFAALSLISLAQCLYYSYHWPLWRITTGCVLSLVIAAGLDVGMVYAIRPSYAHGNNGGVYFFGILASITLAVGLLPQYWEIYKHREVVGISLTFMFVDWLGGVVSLLSLVFRPEFDVLAGVAYSLVIALDGVVLIAALILNPRARRRRR
ncbi:hypothetical protein CYLTODRAFT_337350, partial [Cylindrobasidium torrendii FP15055 ss-10]